MGTTEQKVWEEVKTRLEPEDMDWLNEEADRNERSVMGQLRLLVKEARARSNENGTRP